MLSNGYPSYFYGLLCFVCGLVLGGAVMWRLTYRLVINRLVAMRADAERKLKRSDPDRPCTRCRHHLNGMPPIVHYCRHEKSQTFNTDLGRKTVVVSCFTARFHGKCGADGRYFAQKPADGDTAAGAPVA